MDDRLSAIALVKLTERNRDLISDQLIKSTAPNASELCTGQLDFASTLNSLEDKSRTKSVGLSEIKESIQEHTETVPVRKSTREAAVDLSQAYLMNLSMVRLLNHGYKQEKTVLDNFKPS